MELVRDPAMPDEVTPYHLVTGDITNARFYLYEAAPMAKRYGARGELEPTISFGITSSLHWRLSQIEDLISALLILQEMLAKKRMELNPKVKVEATFI